MVKANIEQQGRHRADHFTVDVVLNLVVSRVAGADGLIALVARQMRQLHFRQQMIAADAEHGLQAVGVRVDQVLQEPDETFHFLELPQAPHRPEREVGVAQPTETIVPVSSRTVLLR